MCFSNPPNLLKIAQHLLNIVQNLLKICSKLLKIAQTKIVSTFVVVVNIPACMMLRLLICSVANSAEWTGGQVGVGNNVAYDAFSMGVPGATATYSFCGGAACAAACCGQEASEVGQETQEAGEANDTQEAQETRRREDRQEKGAESQDAPEAQDEKEASVPKSCYDSLAGDG